MRGSGEELGGYHDYWVRGSGIHSESAVAQNHRVLITILLHLVTFDQLNAYHLSCAECCARNILTIHRATKKSPKAPDFKGLEILTVSKLDGGGSTLHGEFARWTAERQRDEAFAMKQQRLYSEETGNQKKPPQGDGGGKK